MAKQGIGKTGNWALAQKEDEKIVRNGQDARSTKITGIYLCGVGVGLLASPKYYPTKN